MSQDIGQPGIVQTGTPRHSVSRMLRNANLQIDRFIKVRGGSKEPVEAWRNSANQYSPEAPELKTHVDRGGNVGVVCGRGLVVIDVDDPASAPDPVFDLPGTLSVETPGGGSHLYITSDWNDTHRLGWGEIRAEGAYVVGPGSNHPNGGAYRISAFAEINEARQETIKSIANPAGKSATTDRGDTRSGNYPSSSTDPRAALESTNDVGHSLKEIKRLSSKLERCLNGQCLDEHDSPSETDMATVSLLKMYRFDDETISNVLLSWRRVQDRHDPEDYVPRTIGNTGHPPKVPGKLLETLVDQTSWKERPKVGRETIISVARAIDELSEPFTVAEIADSGIAGLNSPSREARMRRIRRTLDNLDGDYIKREKRGGQWQIIRLPAFAELGDYAYTPHHCV